MSTYNTTYNFNQGNMNFGQALLYGAFGSLTGGMGCFGGSYGMGMMSPFGMGGSLFSMMGMGGYGMGYGCDSMIGAQVGMSMANLAYGAISQAIEGRGSAKAEAKAKIDTAKNNVKVLTKEINELEKEKNALGDGFESDKVTVNSKAKSLFPKESDTYTTAHNKVKNNYETATFNFEGEDYHINSAARSAIKAYQEKVNSNTVTNNDTSTLKSALSTSERAYLADIQSEKNAKETLDKKIKEKIESIDKDITSKNTTKTEEEKIIRDAETELNNKNAKLEAKCDAEENEVEDQSNTKKAFNQEYETFKKAQTKENFNKLKEAYNKITGNKKSFRKLMEAILKQHPDFDKTNIDW